MFFFKKKYPKVEIFVRHCHFSKISQHKKRLPNFSKERCYYNLLKTTSLEKANITFLLDTQYPMEEDHFIKKQKEFPVIEIKEGTEAGAFLRLLDYVLSLNLDEETILYFLEDDYLHRENWLNVLLEAFTLSGIDYVTLYDHRDKYFLEQYRELMSKIFVTASCHWRTIPSTTNTFSLKVKTLMRDLDIQRAFSQGQTISRDHEKFCDITTRGGVLISSMPGWATHVEEEYLSPCTDWKSILISL